MAHMMCKCGNHMWDGDGRIVYDVYFKSDFDTFLSKYPQRDKESLCDIIDREYDSLSYRCYFWLCDGCKRVHVWINSENRKLYRVYKIIDKFNGKVKKGDFESWEQIFPLNQNKYDDTPLCDLINTDIIFQYKYYLSNDELKVYVLNKDDGMEGLYELEYESDIETDLKIDSFDNFSIYTITKKNDGHEYIFEDGQRIDITDTKYPYKQVHFMIKEYYEGGGSLSRKDTNKPSEIYNKENMDEFYKKYGEYYKKK